MDIYLAFSRSRRVVDFFTENVLDSNSSVVKSHGLEAWIKYAPDAILLDREQDRDYFLPLECELSLKANFRYESKLLGLYQLGQIPAIIYVCGSERVRRAICQIDEKYCHAYRPKVFYGLREQFQDGGRELVFTNRQGGKLRF